MNFIYIIIAILLFLILVIIIILVAYMVSSAHQQNLSVSMPFEETYRYVSFLNKNKKYKLDDIKIIVTGKIKGQSGQEQGKPSSKGIISLGDQLSDLIREQIIIPYSNCVLVQEADIFNIGANIDDLKRSPIVKQPTIENLSTYFFYKLSPLMPKIGCQLISVKISSESLKATHHRYKMNNYSIA